jgi:hypothetical protein
VAFTSRRKRFPECRSHCGPFGLRVSGVVAPSASLNLWRLNELSR